MRIPKRQSGMTMWGMLYVLGTLAIFLFILFKLIPPFLDDVKINGALESLGRQPDVATMPIGEIKEALRKRLEIDNIDNFNFEHSLSVTARGKTKVVRINYESVTPLLFNASILLTFDHSIEVRGAE